MQKFYDNFEYRIIETDMTHDIVDDGMVRGIIFTKNSIEILSVMKSENDLFIYRFKPILLHSLLNYRRTCPIVNNQEIDYNLMRARYSPVIGKIDSFIVIKMSSRHNKTYQDFQLINQIHIERCNVLFNNLSTVFANIHLPTHPETRVNPPVHTPIATEVIEIQSNVNPYIHMRINPHNNPHINMDVNANGIDKIFKILTEILFIYPQRGLNLRKMRKFTKQ